jgi:hypothetical protein
MVKKIEKSNVSISKCEMPTSIGISFLEMPICDGHCIRG